MGQVIRLLLTADENGRTFDELLFASKIRAGALTKATSRLLRRGLAEQAASGERSRNLTTLAAGFRALKAAYRAGGFRSLETAHFRACANSPTYRLLFLALGVACPLTDLVILGGELDEALLRNPLSKAVHRVLNRLPERWEIRYPQAHRDALQEEPLIVYGNHPSMLTPFLVAAALEREDLRILAHAYVARLVPALSAWVLPIERATSETLHGGHRAGLSHLVTLRLLEHLDPVIDPETARSRNRETISRGSNWVGSGGAALLFPLGGRSSGTWFPGLGRLVLGCLETADARHIRLVPIHVENNSNARVYRLISAGRTARVIRRVAHRQPIRLSIGDPVRLEDMRLPRDATPGQVSRLLQSHYERLAWAPGDVPRWRL